ncbi:uncharacterized protein LOC124428742 [Vespa crabro]|uniref:uncharacterized protein LOC124428742 n=1 Tax=Vespa crabro TaxID=7445 RepID=UPI001F030E64|nr:uncharacterized protein LOC124428742 [Vespa crabro]
MLKKLLSKSGRRILRAIKKLSTRSRKLKRSQQSNCDGGWQTTLGPDLDAVSLSLSLPSLDAKSIDTYMTYVIENIDDCDSRCCHCCDEYEENQRNENIENEMTI